MSEEGTPDWVRCENCKMQMQRLGELLISVRDMVSKFEHGSMSFEQVSLKSCLDEFDASREVI